MSNRAAVYSWGVALIGGLALGYAFGMLSVALGFHPDNTAAPILVLSLPGLLLGIVGYRRAQAGTAYANGKLPLAPSMVATTIGATVAIFSGYGTGNVGTSALVVWFAMVLLPISIGVWVGITVRLGHRTLRKSQSGNEEHANGDEPEGARVASAQSMFRSALRGAGWGTVALFALLIGCIWTVGIPVFMGVLKWDSLLKQPDYSFLVLIYFVWGLPFAVVLGGLVGVVCARMSLKAR